MKNLHLITTDKPSRLFKNKESNLYSFRKFEDKPLNSNIQNQHIHITSDEKIKEGDWFINESNQIEKGIEYYDYKVLSPESKKIILTTDQDLIKDGVQAIDDEFLEWFVKNPSCEEVKIEKFHGMNTSIAEVNFISGDGSLNWEGRSDLRDYKIIIPKEEPKQKTVEESWEDISKEFEIFYNKQNQLYRIENTPTYAFFIFLKENYTLPTKKNK